MPFWLVLDLAWWILPSLHYQYLGILYLPSQTYVILLTFHCVRLLILLDLMHCLTMSWLLLASPYLCMVFQTASKWFILPCPLYFCYTWGTAYGGVLGQSVYSSLPLFSHCLCLFTTSYYHDSVCLFWLSQTLLNPWYCLAPPSSPAGFYSVGPHKYLFTAHLTGIFQGYHYVFII